LIEFITGKVIPIVIIFLIVRFFVRLHFNTKYEIENWAKQNEYKLLSVQYKIWYWQVPYLMGGTHPANFLVKVENKEGEVKEFRITGGGATLLSNKIKVKEIKENFYFKFKI